LGEEDLDWGGWVNSYLEHGSLLETGAGQSSMAKGAVDHQSVVFLSTIIERNIRQNYEKMKLH
jgi:beta-N-acetylglucosaminidase